MNGGAFCNMVQDRGGGSLSHFGKTVNVGLLTISAEVRGVRVNFEPDQLKFLLKIHEH